MTFLPIVERELRVAARLTATYRNRAMLVTAVAGVAMIMLVFGVLSPVRSQVGRSMFWTLNSLALVFCLLEGVRKTADCLSEEKREGTLGLLFLTDLKGYDVILGKLAATSLNSVYGLLSLLPVLALPLLLGGVTPGEFWRVTLALVNILFFSLSTGMLISTFSRREYQAMVGAFVAMAVVSTVPLLVPGHLLSPFSPVYSFYLSAAGNYAANPGGYWHSIEITQAMSWAMLLWASWTVPYSWRERDIAKSRLGKNRAAGPTVERAALRAELLEINPAFWLAARGFGPRIMLAICIALALIWCVILILSALSVLPLRLEPFPVAMVFFLLMNFGLKMRVAAESCHCLAEARRNNALEMLLATPLTVNEIIEGQFLAMRRLFLVPLLTILALEIVGIMGGLFIAANSTVANGRQIVEELFGTSVMAVFLFGYLLLFALDLLAVFWAGLWFGLSAKSESNAVTKTILLALVLPFLPMFLFCYGFPFVFAIPIFWISWASQKVRREFRDLAAQRYLPNPPDAGWLAGVVNQNPTKRPP